MRTMNVFSPALICIRFSLSLSLCLSLSLPLSLSLYTCVDVCVYVSVYVCVCVFGESKRGCDSSSVEQGSALQCFDKTGTRLLIKTTLQADRVILS